MSSRIIYGIDCGFGGAIAELDTLTGQISIADMPIVVGPKGKTELNMHLILDLLDGDQADVWIEKVASRPGQGISSSFRFGEQFGALQMAVAAKGHALRLVTPSQWKRHFGLSQDKGASRSVALQRFPSVAQMFSRVKDADRAEASLIALYGSEVTQ